MVHPHNQLERLLRVVRLTVISMHTPVIGGFMTLGALVVPLLLPRAGERIRAKGPR